MEESGYRISPRQLRRMTIIETGSIGCMMVSQWAGDENGILAVMLSIIGSLLYGGILMAVGRTDGGFYAMTERSMHGFLWRLIWFIYILRFAIRGAWLLSFMELLIRETLFDGARLMILIPLLVVCCYAGMRNLEGRARFAELLFWWIIIPLVLLFLMGLWKADIESVLPREPVHLHKLMAEDYHLMILFLPLELLLFRMSALEGGNRKAWVNGMRGILLAGLWILLVYVVTVGLIGTNWSENELLGVTDAMEMIAIKGGGLERLDILMILFWLIGGIVTLSGYLFQGQQLLRRCLPLGRNDRLAAIWITCSILAIYYSLPSAQVWKEWYLYYACRFDFPISIVLPCVIWILYRKISRKENYRLQKKLTIQTVKRFCFLLIMGMALSTLSGCSGHPAIEERTYVEYVHISSVPEGYRYQCKLAYIDSENTQEGDSGLGESATEDYTVVAESIEDVNEEYFRKAGGLLDYSHLQGIYLSQELYHPYIANELLEDIWEETQVVLSTPIYQEELAIGEQKNETLGNWLKSAKE